jgi:CBS domain-containing protein
LEKAERVMIANGIGSMPVVRDDRIVGLITVKDILRMREKLGSQ